MRIVLGGMMKRVHPGCVPGLIVAVFDCETALLEETPETARLK